MENMHLTYANVRKSGEQSIGVSILADSENQQARWSEAAELVGLRLDHSLKFSSYEDGTSSLSEVVLVDCPVSEATSLTNLSKIDMRVARAGGQMVVGTSADALDQVFSSISQSQSTILVDSGRGELVVALARIMVDQSTARLRELTEDDRSSLLRLTEQVAEIAKRLERLGQQGLGAEGGAFRFQSPERPFKGDPAAERALVKRPKPPLPDARLVRKIIQQRQLRARFFEGELFADPAWDMLLDLAAARVERTRVSVTSLCIASGVPPTTALRWITQMVEAGLLERQQDEIDRRRAFIALTDSAAEAMARYFAELGKDAPLAI